MGKPPTPPPSPAFTLTGTGVLAVQGELPVNVTFTLTGNPVIIPPDPLAVATTQLPSGSVGTLYVAPLAAVHGTPPYVWSVISGTLPSGLSIVDQSVRGIPTVGGTPSIVFQVRDNVSALAQSAAIPLQIVPAAQLVITTAATLPSVSVDVAYAQTIQGTGGVLPYTWAVIAGALPLGLSLNATTGLISGTPTVAGAYAFTIRLTDGVSAITTKAFALTLTAVSAPPLVLTPPPNQTVQIVGTSAPVFYPPATTAGGQAPVTIGYSAPSGSTFPLGTTTVVVTAHAADNQTATATFSVTVAAIPVTPPGPIGTLGACVVTQIGWITTPVAAVPGQVPAGSGVQVGTFATQTDVKQTWSDGSLKYALLGFNATALGVQALSVVAAAGSPFTPSAPVVSVVFTVTAGSGSGSTYTANLGSYSGVDKWRSGSQVVEWRKRVVPATNGGGGTSHANLVVIFDVRSYAGGGHRVDVQVENCKDAASMNSATYTATITSGGSIVYDSHVRDWPAGLTHWAFTAWRKVFVTGTTEGTATVDFTKFYDARLLYRPIAGILAKDWTIDARWNDAEHFGPLRFGMLHPLMNAASGRPELSPYPEWDLEYLATQDAENLTIIRQHGEVSAAWTGGRIYQNDGVSLYKADDGTHNTTTFIPQGTPAYPATLRAPTVFSSVTGGVQYVGARDDNDPVSPTEEVWPRLDNEHPPDVDTVPAIVTGDRFYFDQAKHWANWWIMISAAGSGTYEGVAYGRDTGSYDAVIGYGGFRGTVRGFSRPFRILVSTANILPDADADKRYFVDAVNDNLGWLSDYNTTRVATGDPYHDAALFWEANVNGAFDEYNPANHAALARTVLYHQGFAEMELAHTLWFANATGNFTVPSGALTLGDRMVGWMVAALSTGSDSPLPRKLALNPYYPPVGERNGASGSTVTLVSGLSDFADRAVSDITSIIQGSVERLNLTCVNSTTVTTPTGIFTPEWVGMRVGIAGLEGGNWNETIYTAGYLRIGHVGLYTVTGYNSPTSITLDRKPVPNGTTGVDGVLRSLNWSAGNVDGGILQFNGPQALVGVRYAMARSLPGAAAAKAYADAFSYGGITLNDVLTGQNGTSGYGLQGYGVDFQ